MSKELHLDSSEFDLMMFSDEDDQVQIARISPNEPSRTYCVKKEHPDYWVVENRKTGSDKYSQETYVGDTLKIHGFVLQPKIDNYRHLIYGAGWNGKKKWEISRRIRGESPDLKMIRDREAKKKVLKFIL